MILNKKGLAVMIALNQKNLSHVGKFEYLLLLRCGYCLMVKLNDKYHNKIQVESRAYYSV